MFDSHLLKDLGIVDWGYTEEMSAKSFDRYADWVDKKNHGPLGYLADHRKDLRKSLQSVRSDCKSAVVFLFDYHSTRRALEAIYQRDDYNDLKVASYSLAFNDGDYHLDLTQKLDVLGNFLVNNNTGLEYSFSLDVHPVLERDLAFRAGLGWFGKNSMMISKDNGSFFLIGSLILNQKLDIEKRSVEVDHCGECRACVDACPTDAIDGESRTS